MFYSYLKIIIRNTLTDGMYNFIIVFGLAMGIGAALIIAQYIHFELSFDKAYKDDRQIYMAYMRWVVKNEGLSFDIECHPSIAPLFERSIPDVELAARMVPVALNRSGHEWVLRKQTKNDTEESFIRSNFLYYTDASLLEMFNIKFISGDRKTALREEYTVVLSQKMADKFFPGGDALGEILQLQSYGSMMQLKVVGVAETQPANSSIQFNALISLKSLPTTKTDESWNNPVYRTYVKVRPGSDMKELERKINKAADPYLRLAEEVNGISQHIRFHPFSTIHFFEPYRSRAGAIRFSGDKRLILYFGILAGLILVISWANYINLTTARSIRRAKEVGLRKVNGARPTDLIKQFLTEYLFMNIISMMLAFTIAQLLFGTFASAIGSKAEWIFWTDPMFWAIIVVFLILSTFASGLYPAFILSGYNPAKVLKGNFSNTQSGGTVRKGLVVVQFALSVLLLIGIYVITSQILFMQNKDLGQSAEQVMVINAMEIDTAISRTDAYLRWKMQLSKQSFVKSTCAAGIYPGQSEDRFLFFHRPAEAQQRIGLQTYHVSEGYLKTLNISLLYGRDFDDEKPGELNKLIISKKSAIELGFKDLQAALGEKLKLEGDDQLFEIIGITTDFTTSLKIPLFRHALRYKYFSTGSSHFNYFMVKLKGNNGTDAVAGLQKEWSSLFPETPLDYFFLSNFFHALYKDEYQFAGVFGFFSVVGVVITCMGLYGLSLYNTTIRTKEIGIRKSLGGSVSSIMWLFSKDYLKLIVVASVLALPVGIWQLDNWLNGYPNRISLGADVAIIPVAIALGIAVVTVGYHTYRAACMSPVNSLRAE